MNTVGRRLLLMFPGQAGDAWDDPPSLAQEARFSDIVHPMLAAGAPERDAPQAMRPVEEGPVQESLVSDNSGPSSATAPRKA